MIKNREEINPLLGNIKNVMKHITGRALSLFENNTKQKTISHSNRCLLNRVERLEYVLLKKKVLIKGVVEYGIYLFQIELCFAHHVFRTKCARMREF